MENFTNALTGLLTARPTQDPTEAPRSIVQISRDFREVSDLMERGGSMNDRLFFQAALDGLKAEMTHILQSMGVRAEGGEHEEGKTEE